MLFPLTDGSPVCHRLFLERKEEEDNSDKQRDSDDSLSPIKLPNLQNMMLNCSAHTCSGLATTSLSPKQKIWESMTAVLQRLIKEKKCSASTKVFIWQHDSNGYQKIFA